MQHVSALAFKQSCTVFSLTTVVSLHCYYCYTCMRKQTQLAPASESTAATAAQQHKQPIAFFSKVKAREFQHATTTVVNDTATDTTAAGLAAAAAVNTDESLSGQVLHASTILDSVADVQSSTEHIVHDDCSSDDASCSNSNADNNDNSSSADATHSTAVANSSSDSSKSCCSSSSNSGTSCSAAVNAQRSSEHSSPQQQQQQQQIAITSSAAAANSSDARVMHLATAAHTVTAILQCAGRPLLLLRSDTERPIQVDAPYAAYHCSVHSSTALLLVQIVHCKHALRIRRGVFACDSAVHVAAAKPLTGYCAKCVTISLLLLRIVFFNFFLTVKPKRRWCMCRNSCPLHRQY
jgi:hypothetical protein